MVTLRCRRPRRRAGLKQHLDSLLDERLRAGIFDRREYPEAVRHVRRDVGADVPAPLAAGRRRPATWRAAPECGRVVVGGAHAAPLLVECSRRSSVHAMNASTAATSRAARPSGSASCATWPASSDRANTMR